MKIDKSTTVDIEYGKWDWRLWSDDPNQKWETQPVTVGTATYKYEDEDRTFFGLIYYGVMSHMSYFLDEYFKPVEVLSKCREDNHNYFYFDAGGNGRPVRMHVDELEKAFRILGLLDE